MINLIHINRQCAWPWFTENVIFMSSNGRIYVLHDCTTVGPTLHHWPQELKKVMNILFPLHERPVPSCQREGGLSHAWLTYLHHQAACRMFVVYMDEWLAKMVAWWSHLAIHRD